VFFCQAESGQWTVSSRVVAIGRESSRFTHQIIPLSVGKGGLLATLAAGVRVVLLSSCYNTPNISRTLIMHTGETQPINIAIPLDMKGCRDTIYGVRIQYWTV